MKLNELVIMHNINIKDFAFKMGVSPQAVYEYGKKNSVSLRTVVRASNAFKTFGVELSPSEIIEKINRS